MADNTTLHKAKKAKKDEFYTQLVDISNELRHYKGHFEGKVVYCNCDDPYESNFFKFFAANFNTWGLKKLITTCFDGSPVSGEQLSLEHIEGMSGDNGREEHAYKIEITSVTDLDGDGAVGLSDVELLLKQNGNVVSPLEGNGDFRSPECVALLEEADIVVTNPPFSLFREYVAQLVEHDKQFLVLGDQNAITYKEIFPLLKDERVWLGVDNGGTKWFRVPMDYDIQTESRKKIEDGIKYISMGRINWFTNLDNNSAKPPLTLFREYNPEDYPRYDNFDAINVDRVADIPVDYYGVMGVPITYMDKHNPSHQRERERERDSGSSNRSASQVTTSTTAATSTEPGSTTESSSNVRDSGLHERPRRDRRPDSTRPSQIRQDSHSTFRILGLGNSARVIGHGGLTVIDGRKVYNRVFIRRLRSSDFARATMAEIYESTTKNSI